MCVDLHTHSVYSDGTATPAQLISMAVAGGLTGFALTDHDTVEGVQEAVVLGEEQGIAVISGLELSARHGEGCIHILGYGVDVENLQLAEGLAQLQEGRTERNLKILAKLNGLGIAITSEETERLSGCGQTGRPHIARLLLAKGYVQTLNQAFTLYLGRNKAAWCDRFAYSAAETIAIIHEAGGVAVLAHPGIIDPELKAQPQLIRELAERHLDGVEIYYPGHNFKMIQLFSGLAKQHRLLVTGGSDYHGDSRIKGLAGKATGFFPPDSIMEQIRDRLRVSRTPTPEVLHHADHTCC
ncbi:PHP domain-containing protein [Desulfobulbus sp. F5]|nr:PHP domain-containing protein [Desulfobulbus sp. F5]